MIFTLCFTFRLPRFRGSLSTSLRLTEQVFQTVDSPRVKTVMLHQDSTGHKPFMDLPQVGGDVSLGPLIICCYSQAFVIIDKHPVSLRYSSNRVLLQPEKRTRGTKKPNEKNEACVSLHTPFLYLRLQPSHKAQHLLSYHDRRHPDCSGTIHIKSPKTPNRFLGIYPKEIAGQVLKRSMCKVVRCCVLHRSKRLQTHPSQFFVC